MKKITLLFLITFCFNSYAQLPFVEDFETATVPSGLPVGWSIDNAFGSFGEWTINDPTTGTPSYGGSAGIVDPAVGNCTNIHAVVDSDGLGSGGTQDTSLISPVIDLSAYTDVVLSFNHWHRAYSSSIAYVESSTNLGASWQNVATYDADAFGNTSIDVSNLAGYPSVQIRFRYTGAFEYWWAVDDVTLSEPPACAIPTDLSVSNVTNDSATLNWVSDGSQFMIEIQPAGVAQGTAGTGYVIGDVTPYPLNYVDIPAGSFTANTSYDFFVVNVCNEGNSDYSSGFRFTTACDAVSESGAWSNDFQTNSDCWEVINSGDANGWQTYSFTSGEISFGIEYSATAHDDYLISPGFSVIDGVSDQISFDARNNNAGYPELFNVQVWDAGITTMLGTLDSQITASGAEFETFSYDLSIYEGQDIRVAIHATDTNQWALFVDNFVVEAFIPLGIDENQDLVFSYYPNPVNDKLTINAQTNVNDIAVLNMLGQVVSRQTPNNLNCEVDMAALRTGVYFVQVSIGNKTQTIRVLKQ
jgi:hypothetical protein